MKIYHRFWIFATVFCSSCVCNAQSSVKLSWNANPEPDIAGYTVYYGTDSAVLDNTVKTGNTTTAVVPNLQPETTYYFAITATNTTGLTSDMSDPISYTTPLNMAGAEVVAFSSQEVVGEDAPAAYSIDGNRQTIWHTQWKNSSPLPPHYITIRLPKPATCSELFYVPRQDGEVNGHIIKYEIESSLDGIVWEKWSTGTWNNDATSKTAQLPLKEVRFVRLWGNERYAAASEISLGGVYSPDPVIEMVKIDLQESSDLSVWTDLSTVSVPKVSKQFFRLGVNVSGSQMNTIYKLVPVNP